MQEDCEGAHGAVPVQAILRRPLEGDHQLQLEGTALLRAASRDCRADGSAQGSDFRLLDMDVGAVRQLVQRLFQSTDSDKWCL